MPTHSLYCQVGSPLIGKDFKNPSFVRFLFPSLTLRVFYVYPVLYVCRLSLFFVTRSQPNWKVRLSSTPGRASVSGMSEWRQRPLGLTEGRMDAKGCFGHLMSSAQNSDGSRRFLGKWVWRLSGILEFLAIGTFMSVNIWKITSWTSWCNSLKNCLFFTGILEVVWVA